MHQANVLSQHAIPLEIPLFPVKKFRPSGFFATYFSFLPYVKSLNTYSGSSPVEIDATLDLAVVLEFPQQIVAPVLPSVPTMCSPYTPASSAVRSM